ncbi:hypothetical protein MMC12_007256, partial [Toensbergia leucococca]|nr:hypothetical protein [Toensbergia leucococca]
MRVIRELEIKAAERKGAGAKQKEGKAERRVAGDEKRKVYRKMKLTWETIKEEVLNREAPLNYCDELGFAFRDTPRIEEIKPTALDVEGIRIDLGAAPDYAKAQNIPTADRGDGEDPGDFIKLDIGDGQYFETLNYNHKIRRKLKRAIEGGRFVMRC